MQLGAFGRPRRLNMRSQVSTAVLTPLQEWQEVQVVQKACAKKLS